MDMGWSTNAVESFRMFQGKVLDEYDRLVDEFGLSVVNARAASPISSASFRRLVSQHLEIETAMTSSSTNPPEDDGANGGVKPGHYYGYGVPYLPIDDYPGKLIAIEGTDGVGRIDADRAAARVARSAGLRRHRDGLDAVRADAADDRSRQVEQHAQQAHLRPALRDRLRRSPRKGNHPGAQGRLHRPLRSLHLHGAGAGRRARRRSHLDPQPVRVRDRAAPGLLPEDRRRRR